MVTVSNVVNKLISDRNQRQPASQKTISAVYLGTIKYDVALELQKLAMKAVIDGKITGILLLMQHPAVFTIGRFRGDNEFHLSPETLQQKGIKIVNTNRGGSITCHEIGQLVGYPIINLKKHNLGVRDYVNKLEEVIIRSLHPFGIDGIRIRIYPGVWVEDQKICSIGIHVSESVTTHGFALNVNNDLRHFALINPCGIKGISMTSMSRLLRHEVEMESVVREVLVSFSSVFECKCREGFV